MVTCELCNKEFPYAWKLRRHLTGKKSCVQIAKDSQAVAKDSQAVAKDSQAVAKDSQAVAKDECCCRYCGKEFKRLFTMRNHEEKCNTNDEIWKLETECKVEHKQQRYLECKYCKFCFTRRNNLTRHLATCKAKEEYKQMLEKMLNASRSMQGASQVANTINNNNTQNASVIVNVNALGKENLEHVTMKKVESIIRRIIDEKYPGDNNLYKLSAEAVAEVHKLVRDKEENRNVVIPHERRQIALVKRNENGDFVKEGLNEVLDDSFRNTSRKIYDIGKDVSWLKKKEINIHKCVGSFSRKGFQGHPEMPKNSGRYMHRREDVQTAKRKYKMANMYDGEEVPIMEDEEVPITEDKEVPITEDKEVPIMEDDEWDMILG